MVGKRHPHGSRFMVVIGLDFEFNKGHIDLFDAFDCDYGPCTGCVLRVKRDSVTAKWAYYHAVVGSHGARESPGSTWVVQPEDGHAGHFYFCFVWW